MSKPMDNDETQETSIIDPVDGDASDEVTTSIDDKVIDDKRRRQRRVLWIVAASVAAVALLGAAIYGVATRRSTAIRACENANKTYSATYEDYKKTVGEGETLSRTIISKDQVADAKTYDTFHKLVNEKISPATPLNCNISFTDSFSASTTSIDSKTSALKSKTEQLKTAMKNVQASKDKKDLTDARNTAQAKLDTATKTYTDSEGKVADNATRDTLKTLIDALRKALEDKHATVETLTKAGEPVQGAIDQVNQSVQAKSDADKKAQEEAQRTQQQQQQQQQRSSTPRRGYTSNQQRYTPRTNNGGNRGGGSTPAPQSNNNGGGSSFDWQAWMNNRPQAPCEAQGNCSQAIG
ncbi:hypothetical protein EJ419_06330 [Alloscardovia theropitheci]|uniref:Colicin transporter n=1 Tax=Alloscardovia theropitheci TaxID=2496842 RepID=A0A4R0QZ62_9BIFI|nr:hypothetical protein [Alloscardovia theropitheci]TCD53866.1 hypothetical protein EJ419_06330 [Alloscardovia theropitheci]